MLGPSPYALAAPVFPFRALAALAGRAPLGGPRETALATLVAARLAAGATPPALLAPPARAARAEAARLWLTSIALPAAVRGALLRLADASGTDDLRAIAVALARVTEVTAPHLDRGARSELDRLGARLTG
ncbi:MAG TPA: hypothetical protein VJL28_07325 [Gemmatimonadaceae bacterium]|nr:hypothetical protein [Gemmatimonadaceae bacterium]